MGKDIVEIRERLVRLEKAVFGEHGDTARSSVVSSGLDFSLNERAFIKKYASGFNGQEFFTLITAYQSKGKESAPVELAQIKTTWKGSFGIIGIPYASIFSTRAKDKGWIDTLKGSRGSYTLGKHWQEILKIHEQTP